LRGEQEVARIQVLYPLGEVGSGYDERSDAAGKARQGVGGENA